MVEALCLSLGSIISQVAFQYVEAAPPSSAPGTAAREWPRAGEEVKVNDRVYGERTVGIADCLLSLH